MSHKAQCANVHTVGNAQSHNASDGCTLPRTMGAHSVQEACTLPAESATLMCGDSSGIPGDLEAMIERMGEFWDYSDEDFRIIRDLAAKDPEGWRLLCLADAERWGWLVNKGGIRA
jgi:hypothetical protein